MAGEKNTVIHDERALKPKKRQRVRRVCARWWWLFLLIFICVVLIVVLPIVYVAYPKMARKQVASSRLEVKSMTIQNPTPDSVELAFTQVLRSNSSFHPTLYPFNASFYILDNESNPPFASIQTPEIKALDGLESNIEPQEVNITHPEEFTRYVLLALASEEFTVALRGDGDLKQGALPKTSVRYDQNITLKGFDHLSGFSLQSFHVLNDTEADGTNAVGVASIYNPTVMTIDLGRVTLKMSVNGTDVGFGTIESLVLSPGDNLLPMRAEVYQLVVVGIVIARQNPIIPVDIKGINSTYNGQLLPYYTTMLQATALSIDLNVTAAVEGSGLVDKRALTSLR